MGGTLLKSEFRSDTPVLPDIKIVETWAYYDGPLFGVCEIHGQKLFFMDVVFDTWRYYEDGKHERLWAIYGVYDLPIEKARELVANDRRSWGDIIDNESNCIGIFWEYGDK